MTNKCVWSSCRVSAIRKVCKLFLLQRLLTSRQRNSSSGITRISHYQSIYHLALSLYYIDNFLTSFEEEEIYQSCRIGNVGATLIQIRLLLGTTKTPATTPTETRTDTVIFSHRKLRKYLYYRINNCTTWYKKYIWKESSSISFDQEKLI